MVASLAGGTPLICEVPYGQGKVLAIGSGLSKNESDWALSPAFLVFWRELLNSCAKNDLLTKLSIELEAPIPSELKTESLPDSGKSGNYKVSISETPYILSINPPAQESDTMQIAQNYPWKDLINSEKKLEKKSEFIPGDSTESYWKILLILALFCAAAELLIANRTAL